MTFNSACKFCYEEFKKEHNTGIGTIQECDKYWVFYKSSEEQEYGNLPIVVYKEDKQPIFMTFEVYLQLSKELHASKEIPVPERYKQ